MTDMILDGMGPILERASPTGSETIYVHNPSQRIVEELIEFLDPETTINVRLAAPESTLKAVLDDFIVASTTADLEAADVLAMKGGIDDPGNAVVATDSIVIPTVTTETTIYGLGTEDSDFVAAVWAHANAQWREATPFRNRTPPKNRVRETLSSEIGDDVRADFDAMLSALGTARGDADGLDEVAISLLVAARNGVLLYDISKWGEDVGLASKATFSRAKTRLENEGLIDTEKVPIEVGRPRLRLILGDEGLAGADIDELTNVAIGRLES